MFRRALVAALLCWAALATADRLITCASEGITAGAATATYLQDPSDGTDSSDQRWDAGHRTSASITESVWRSQLHHSELASVSCAGEIVAVFREDLPHRRARQASHDLHPFPLLI